jgi:hypothetical protein
MNLDVAVNETGDMGAAILGARAESGLAPAASLTASLIQRKTAPASPRPIEPPAPIAIPAAPAIEHAAAAVAAVAIAPAARAEPVLEPASVTRARDPRPIDLSRIHTIHGSAPAPAGIAQRLYGEAALFVSVFIGACAVALFAYLNAG